MRKKKKRAKVNSERKVCRITVKRGIKEYNQQAMVKTERKRYEQHSLIIYKRGMK